MIRHGSFYFSLLTTGHRRHSTRREYLACPILRRYAYSTNARACRKTHVYAYQRCDGGVGLYARTKIGSPEWYSFQTGLRERITPIFQTPACTQSHAHNCSLAYPRDENICASRIYNYYRSCLTSFTHVILRTGENTN